MTIKESKHHDSQLREKIIMLAKDYTKEDISYMSKNSRYNPEMVVKNVSCLHITNGVIKNAFLTRVKKLQK